MNTADALDILGKALLVQAAGSTPKLLKKQFPDNVKEIEELATHDPSGNKYAYLEWMWKQVRNGASVEEVSEKITTFHAIAEEFKIPFKAKDLKELDKVIEENQEKLAEVRTKQGHGQNKDNEPVALYTKSGYKAIEVFKHEDVCELGEGTTWCVSDPETNYFRDYNKPGTRWIFLTSPNGERRMAMLRQKHGQKNEDAAIEQLRDEEQTGQKDVGPNDWSRKILDEMGFSAWYGVDAENSAKILKLLKTPRGKKWLLTTNDGSSWLTNTEAGEAWFKSPDGQAWFKSPDGGSKWLLTYAGGYWLRNDQAGEAWPSSPDGQAWFKSPDGQAWFKSPDGGRKWLLTDAGGYWLRNDQAGQAWLSSPDGQAWLSSPDGGRKWLFTNGGSWWLISTKAGEAWFKSPDGQAWFKSPDGQAWARENPNRVELVTQATYIEALASILAA